MTTPIKAEVRKSDLDRFKLDGGVLVLYPATRPGQRQIAGLVPIEIVEKQARKPPLPKGPLKGDK